MKKILAIVTIACLLWIAGLQAYSLSLPEPEITLKEKLGDLIDVPTNGWFVRDLPLGNTEAIEEASLDILRFDDFVYREYRKADTVFTVYAAYWEPGKMPVRYVQSHTPDRCWTRIGWEMVEHASQQKPDYLPDSILPTETRVFRADDYPQHVMFWHILGGEVHEVGAIYNDDTPFLDRMLITLDKYFFNVEFNQRKEQFFVRIASEKPIDKFAHEQVFQDVMKALGEVCLNAKTDA